MKSAYHHHIPDEDLELTHVDKGSPMGELLRRYWQPAALSSELDDLPKAVRIMGEDLVLFRDGDGKVGCLDAHCAHRGTSLEFGRVEEDGIRCCLHGWKYTTEGQCIEMPCEEAGFCERQDVWQPAYPVEEFGGLAFIYMGPPEVRPLLPMYDIIDPGRTDVEVRGMRLWDDHSIGFVRDCNWLQHYENVVDPWHLLILHNMISGDQFGSVITEGEEIDISFETTDLGVRYRFVKPLPNGNTLERYTENIMPNIFLVSSIHEDGSVPKDKDKCTEVSWVVPVDNTHLYGISLVAWPLRDGKPVEDWKPGTDTMTGIRPGNLRDRPYEEKQRRPDDMEAQESQRPIVIHALERLTPADKGVAMVRHQLRRGLVAIAAGEDPPNIVRDPAANHAIPTNAWNTIHPPAPAEAAE